MHFSSIELYNYGIYCGKHEIKLSDQIESRNITLVGGMNGRGKTTILDSIFLCLYGRKATEYITGKKESYNKVLSDRINKSSTDQQTYIKLTMEMDDDANTHISILRSWSKTGRKVNTSLSVNKNGILDDYLSDNWEYYVEELVPFGIAKFFFFDNEKISQIADDDAFGKIKESIKSVMGVTTIESLCAHVEKIRKTKNTSVKKSNNTALQTESEEIAKAIDECDARMRQIHAQRAAIVPELERANVLIEQTEQEFWKKGGNLGLNHDDIVRDQRELKDKIATVREEAISIASSPATPLVLCKTLTHQAYNKIVSEETSRAKQYSLPVIQEMYMQLLNSFRQNCEDAPEYYEQLKALTVSQLQKLESEISEESLSTLTPLGKSLIERFIFEDCNKIIEHAKKLIGENAKYEAALQQIEVHLSSSAEKNDTVRLLKRIKKLQGQKTQLETDINKCDEQLKSCQYEREQLERRLNKVILKIAAEADTSDDNIRIIEYSTMTLEIMEEFIHRLQAQKVSKLEKHITSCFQYLAQKEAIITSISINPKTLDITLKDYKGGILLKNQLSAGEKQMFAISILWGLALTSGYKLPVIIDTPMARLDSAHRTNFINKYLPNASSQVIVLSTDEEINGKYLEDIKTYVNQTYTLVYNESEKSSSIQSGYFGGQLL